MTQTEGTVIDTFKRVEDKYFLTKEQMEEVIRRSGSHLMEDVYFKYTVRSVYCDSGNADLVIRSLMGTGYKAKLRLRCYGEPEHSPIFLETKKKWEGIVYKKRIMLGEQEAYDYLNDGIPHHVHNNTAGEIDYMIRYYGLKPKVFIAYDRICYAAAEESDVRVTFDYNIRYRLHDLDLREYGDEIPLEKAEFTMEVKAMDRYPIWLTEILSDLKLYQGSFSKYGTIYTQNLETMTPRAQKPYRYAQYSNQKERAICSVQY